MLHRISFQTHTFATIHEKKPQKCLLYPRHNKCYKLFTKVYFSDRHLKSAINYFLKGPANPGPGASNKPFWTVFPTHLMKKAQVYKSGSN